MAELTEGAAIPELRVTPDDRELGIPDFYTKQGFRHRGRQIMEFTGE